jgi:uncharacterized protein GlcG (DUF336 family)
MKFRIKAISACAVIALSTAALAGSRGQALPLGAKGPVGVGPSGKLLVLISKELITRVEAQHLVEAAIDVCARRGVPASALVLDANGAERAELSDDNTPLIGLITAEKKARTVLAFKTSTKRLMARVKADKAFADRYGRDNRYFLMPGGIPIYKHGKFVAILAVGGTHTHDDACAIEALKTVPWAGAEAPATSQSGPGK